MYNHIIWDFDGTLFDTYPVMVNSFKKALEDYGANESIEHIMELMKVSEAYLIEYCRERYGIDENFKGRYDKVRKSAEIEYVKPFMNIKNICEEIFRNGKNNYLYTHRGTSAIEFLKKFDLYDCFRDFITKENRFRRKPDPEALIYLIEKHSIPKNTALMVGDRDIDLQAGKNAGIHACCFTNGELIDSQFADYSIDEFAQLYNIIGLT